MEDGFSLKDATVGIFGLGLMGGSLAMSLKGKCSRLIGFDSHPPTLEAALSLQIVDYAESDPARLLPELDLLILAAPIPAILNFLRQSSILRLPLRQAQRIGSGQVTNPSAPLRTSHQLPITILDLGSTKREIVQAMSALPKNFDPIGGHPICGKETLGIENADANLYQDAPFIVTPLERTTQRAIRFVRELITAIGARPIEMGADEHDEVFAATSHVPFLLSSALALSTPKAFAPFIGPGFRSTSRLAGTSSSMMLGVLQSNRDNVLNAIQTFRALLDKIESALHSENYAELEAILNQSRKSHLTLTVDHKPPTAN